MLTRIAAEGPRIAVDAGGSLSAKDLSNLPAARAKAGLFAQIYARDGIDGMTLSARDWQLGRGFVEALVEAHRLPVLAANLECDGRAPYPGHRVVTVGAHTIGIIGATDGVVPGCEVGPVGPALGRAARAVADADLVVALLPQERRTLATLGSVPADVAVIRGPSTRIDLGTAMVVAPRSRGKELGELRVALNKGASKLWSPEVVAGLQTELDRHQASLTRVQGEADNPRKEGRIAAARRRVDRAQTALDAYGSAEGAHSASLILQPLSRDVADHPPTAKAVSALLAGLEAEAGGSIPDDAPRLVGGVGPYIGADGCTTCHGAPHAQWESTPHATAWETLRDDQHGRDPACVGCHVTGWKEAGGPRSVDEISAFRGVQCEACHGPGRRHAGAGTAATIQRSPPESLCRTCHDGDRDGGRFDHESYRPQVVHGP